MTFVNERSGTALVTRVLMPKLIRFRNRHFQYAGGKHAVSGIDLSKDLHETGADAEMITRLAENVLALYFRAEEEKGLRFEIPEESLLRGFLPDAHVTGMTFLNLFTRDVLRLTEAAEGEAWTLFADPVLQEAVPDAERKLGILMKAVLAFGKEHGKVRIVFEPGDLVRTEQLEEHMSLTYGWDRQFEQTYLKGEYPESAETEREKAVRLNREASLRKTLELIRVINEEASPRKEEEAPKHG